MYFGICVLVFLYFLLSGWICNWDHYWWAQSSVIWAFYPLAKALHGHLSWSSNWPTNLQHFLFMLWIHREIFDPANFHIYIWVVSLKYIFSSVIWAFYPLAKALHGHHSWWSNRFPAFCLFETNQFLLVDAKAKDDMWH